MLFRINAENAYKLFLSQQAFIYRRKTCNESLTATILLKFEFSLRQLTSQLPKALQFNHE